MIILMTGEIYLKKGPKIVMPNIEDYMDDEEFEAFIEDLRINSNASEELINSLIEEHEKDKKIMETGLKDYSGCDSFWMSIIEEEGIRMVEKNDFQLQNMEKVFRTKEEIDREFIRLRVFLEKAQYVGKYFKRTAPLDRIEPNGIRMRDINYNRGPVETLILYADDHLMLAIQTRKLLSYETKRFCIISPKYLEDGNYEIYGEVNNEYDDTGELYYAILKQLTDNKNKKLL